MAKKIPLRSVKILLRSIRQICKADEEILNRIWYDRELILQQNLKIGKKTIDLEIKKGMLAAMKRVEAEYSGINSTSNYYKNDFGWGVIIEKLSILRRVLDDERNNLDT